MTPNNPDNDDDDEDEEVFFGPQTHNERIAAVVVKEKEAQQQCPLETLTAEQQALLLRETALLSVRIKHGTPGNTKGSPVAVVHPMPRSVDSFSSNNASRNESVSDIDKENCKPQLDAFQNPKSSQVKDVKKATVVETKKVPTSKLQLLQPKFGLNKGRPSSQPEISLSTKLPVTKLRRAKVQSEMSEVCGLSYSCLLAKYTNNKVLFYFINSALLY